MRHFETITVPEQTKRIEIYTSCDFCKEKIVEELHKTDKCSVSMRVGSHYPGGGYGEETSVDMCTKCFQSKLIPWIKSQGVEPQFEDIDY